MTDHSHTAIWAKLNWRAILRLAVKAAVVLAAIWVTALLVLMAIIGAGAP